MGNSVTTDRLMASFERQIEALPDGFSKWIVGQVARQSGFDMCGLCAADNEVTLVRGDAHKEVMHGYAGTTGCPTLPWCSDCVDAMGEPDDDVKCDLCGYGYEEED